jgi:hypothetical protein
MSEENAASEEAGEAEVTPKDDATEKRAREMGWRPKDEFKGNPDNWTDAATYVQRGETVLPLVKAQNKRLEAQIEDMRESVKQIVDRFVNTEKKEFERQIADLKKQLNQAVKEGDEATAEKTAEEMADLKKNQPTERQAAAQVRPEVKEWLEENPWFVNDDELHEYAENLHIRLGRTRKDMSLEENLAFVARDVKKRFPEKFSNPNRAKPAAVEGSSGAAVKSKSGRDYADLDAASKAACDKYVKQGLMTRQRYLELYDWS